MSKMMTFSKGNKYDQQTEADFCLKTELLAEIYVRVWLLFKNQLLAMDCLCSSEFTRHLSCNEMSNCQAEANHHFLK